MKKQVVFYVLLSCILVMPFVGKAQEAINSTEFSLTKYADATRGWVFLRPTSWMQDNTFKTGLRFVGGDESLEWTVLNSTQTAAVYATAFLLPNTEIKIGAKPFTQGKFNAQVISSKSTAQSGVTSKTLNILIDRWVFSPAKGKIAMLKVLSPTKIFDWEGNRDMVLSFKFK